LRRLAINPDLHDGLGFGSPKDLAETLCVNECIEGRECAVRECAVGARHLAETLCVKEFIEGRECAVRECAVRARHLVGTLCVKESLDFRECAVRAMHPYVIPYVGPYVVEGVAIKIH